MDSWGLRLKGVEVSDRLQRDLSGSVVQRVLRSLRDLGSGWAGFTVEGFQDFGFRFKEIEDRGFRGAQINFDST